MPFPRHCPRLAAAAVRGARAYPPKSPPTACRFVPHTDAALAEFARVVKPGGLLAVAVFQGMAHQPFYSFLGQLAAGEALLQGGAKSSLPRLA